MHPKLHISIYLDFYKGSVFDCPDCKDGTKCKVYDTTEKIWRHINFFQYNTQIIARFPRIKCEKHGVKQIESPWARNESGFTLLFEALLITLSKNMPVYNVAKIVGEHDTRIWRVIKHYTDLGREKLDLSDISRIGIDETSCKKGHNYITVVVDMDNSKVIYATEGKDSKTIEKFTKDLKDHNGVPENITDISMDMSSAFISGAEKYLPNADITFDKFHVMKVINNAVNEVRRIEAKEQEILIGTRYLWLKNKNNLTAKQQENLDNILSIKDIHLNTVRAYNIKLSFQDLFKQDPDVAEIYLNKWYFWATHSRLDPIIEAAHTIKNHWNGILKWFKSGLTNGVVEGINGEIQEIKARARGFRNTENFIAMIYLKLGSIVVPSIHLQ